MKVKCYRSVLGRDGYVSVVAENGNYVCDGRKQFNSPDIIEDFCRRELGMDGMSEEYVYCFALDNKCKLNGVFEVSHCTVNASMVSPREVFQKLLALNAANFILVHNHPSGDATPSKKDIDVTERMKQCGALLDVPLIDHIIIGNYGSVYSLAEREWVV